MASTRRAAGHLQEPLLEDDWPGNNVKGCVAGFYVLGIAWLVLDPNVGAVLAILAALCGTFLLRHDPHIAPCVDKVAGVLPLPCPSNGEGSFCAACEGENACATPLFVSSVATAVSGLLYTLTLSTTNVSSLFILRPFIALVTASLGVYAAAVSWHIRNTRWRTHGGRSYYEASVASAQLQRADSPPGLELPHFSQQSQHRATQPTQQQQQQHRQQQQQNLQQQEEEDYRLAIARSLADQGGTGSTSAVAQVEDSGTTGGPQGPISSPGEDLHHNAQEESASDSEIEISEEVSAESGNFPQKGIDEDNDNDKDNNNDDNDNDNDNNNEAERPEVLEKQLDLQQPVKVEEKSEPVELVNEVGAPMTEEECARRAARAAVQASVAAVLRRLTLHPAAEEVCIYKGFTEHAYRLVFAFEDHFAPDAPCVLTVMPSGVVETREILKPQKEDALIAFTYPQSISDELADSPVSVKAVECQDDSSLPADSSPRILRETPFVWRRDDGSNALVQTWPTEINAQFRKTFEISEGINPNSEKFQPQAVAEFQESMVRLFGPAATKQPILYCHKVTVNTSPAVTGITEHVLAHIKEDSELMRELAILSVDNEGLGFVADGTSGDGQKFEKHFTMTAGERCVVYRKVGWDTMGCIKPLHQFLNDAELHEPPTVNRLAGDKTAAASMEEDAHDGPAESLEIMVRLPNGSRMRRTFQSTDKIAMLYDAVDAECNEAGVTLPCSTYLLATSHPRFAYNDRNLTLAQAGISNQVMLHIEKPKPQPQQ